ncbi:hypothetical protein EDC30_102324 [Paucimonas lemoignei]|uniref:Uncharacterized protein n=2 Tax=Paucimonas lemoignei TaxID=29443 RepID=A0A4R3I1T6_PAULE|nr:hypothetical protein EDC30_102324 [Paucimonas lemoignei]
MTIKDGQNKAKDNSASLANSGQQLTDAASSRRQFTKAGLGLSGVVLSLASRPVLGDVVCKSPSGFLSGNASTHGPQPVCKGRSPGYWKNHKESWPIATDTEFRRVFPASPTSVYAKYTLLQLLSPQKDDRQNLGMHLVAAYLNAISGWTPFLTTETIIAMFSEWQSKGTFSPTATVHWTSAEIVTYLKATQA